MPITKLRIMYIMLNAVSEAITGVMKEVFRLWLIRIHPLVGSSRRITYIKSNAGENI